MIQVRKTAPRSTPLERLPNWGTRPSIGANDRKRRGQPMRAPPQNCETMTRNQENKNKNSRIRRLYRTPTNPTQLSPR